MSTLVYIKPVGYNAQTSEIAFDSGPLRIPTSYGIQKVDETETINGFRSYEAVSNSGNYCYFSYANLTAAGGDMSGDFTAEFWFRPSTDTASSNYRILYLRSSGGLDRCTLFHNPNTKELKFTGYNSSNVRFANQEVVATLTASTWSHIAVVQDGTTIRIMVDGTQVQTYNEQFGG